MKVKNIFFDFNGTLVNDVDLCLELLNTMLKMRGHDVVSLNEYLEIFDFPVIEYYKKAGFVFPEDDFDTLAKYFIKEYSKRNLECPLYDGVKEVLKYFKEKGVNLYIVSASEINLLNNQLSIYGIKDYFLGVSGLDNINASSKIETGKRFIERLNINKDESIFVGDTLHDVEVSDELGLECILIDKGHQSRKRLLTSKKIVLSGFRELLKIID